MKEREKLFTAILLLIITIIFTISVCCANNIFGIRALIEEKESSEINYSAQEQIKIPDEVLMAAEEIKELYVSGSYSEIYSLANEDFHKKGAKKEFIKYCRTIKQMHPEKQEYILRECNQGRENDEYKAVYAAEKSNLIIYIKESGALFELSGFEIGLSS